MFAVFALILTLGVAAPGDSWGPVDPQGASPGGNQDEAQVLFATGRYRECLVQTRAACAEDPDDEDWVLLHLRTLLVLGECEEALQILTDHADPKLRGVAHCFTGNATQAKGFADRGFGVSFTGVVTFKKATDVQQAAIVVPLELLLVETDCPYMSPVPKRGKRCEPAFVIHTARAIAALRGVDEQIVFDATAENAKRIFALPL